MLCLDLGRHTFGSNAADERLLLEMNITGNYAVDCVFLAYTLYSFLNFIMEFFFTAMWRYSKASPTGATSETGVGYPSGAPELILVFVGLVLLKLNFSVECCVFNVCL